MGEVLIIRPAYVEDVPNTVSNLTSATEAFSASVLLNHFGNDQVTVVTNREAVGLFRGIRNVRRALVYDHLISAGLSQEHFDVLVNLEPLWEFCALAESVPAEQRFGFTLDEYGQEVVPLPGSEELLIFTRWMNKRRSLDRPMQELLYECVGARWQGEPYRVGIKPVVGEQFDVGFNIQGDRGWLNKDWSERRWRELEALCERDYAISYSYQEYGDDLAHYVNWIASCRVVVTQDAIGLYLALALGRRVVGLFGPTSPKCMHLYGLGEAVAPGISLGCIPCHELECRFRRSCVESISPSEVFAAVERQVQAAPVDGND